MNDSSRQMALEVFRNANQQQPRMSWEERKKLIAEQFPSVEKLDWYEALGGSSPEPSDVFINILRDVLKADTSEPGRHGPRRALEWDKGMASLRRLTGNDYSSLPFNEAFAVLVGTRSLTSVAHKTGLSKTVVFRFLRNERQPTRAQMEAIARGFKKHASFFLEYRNAMLVDLVEQRLADDPDNSMALYRQAFFGVGARP